MFNSPCCSSTHSLYLSHRFPTRALLVLARTHAHNPLPSHSSADATPSVIPVFFNPFRSSRKHSNARLPPNRTDPPTLTTRRHTLSVTTRHTHSVLQKLTSAACLQCHPLSLRSHDSNILNPNSDSLRIPSFPTLSQRSQLQYQNIPFLYSLSPHTVSTRHSEYFSFPRSASIFQHTNMLMPSHTGYPFSSSNNNTSNRQFQVRCDRPHQLDKSLDLSIMF